MNALLEKLGPYLGYVVLAAGVAMFGVVEELRVSRASARADAAELARATASMQAITAKEEVERRAAAAAAELDAKTREYAARVAETRMEVGRAQDSKGCSESAPVRAVLDSLRGNP